MAPKFEVTSAVMRLNGSHRRHSGKEGVAEGGSCHQLRAYTLLKQLDGGRAMLLEELLIGAGTFFNVIHPLPGAFIEGMLAIVFRVVVSVLTIGFPQLLVLVLESLQISFEVFREREVASRVIGL